MYDHNSYLDARKWLTQWSRLRTWVAEAREDRLLADEVERDAAKWTVDADPSLLWRKRRLIAAEDLAKRADVGLSDAASAFLSAARSSERRGRLLLAIQGGLLVAVAVGSAVFYLRNVNAARVEAVKNSELARMNGERAFTSEKRSKENEERALRSERLALESATQSQKDKRAAEDAKIKAEKERVEFEKALESLQSRLKDAKGDAEKLRRIAFPACVCPPYTPCSC